MIVKVQLPWLNTTEDPDTAYVYNQDRSVEFFLPATGDLVDMMDGDLRAFFDAEVDGDQCELLEKVEEQGW